MTAHAPRPANATLILLASLYCAQGLPSGLLAQSLPVLLRQHGVDLAGIGIDRAAATDCIFRTTSWQPPSASRAWEKNPQNVFSLLNKRRRLKVPFRLFSSSLDGMNLPKHSPSWLIEWRRSRALSSSNR